MKDLSFDLRQHDSQDYNAKTNFEIIRAGVKDAEDRITALETAVIYPLTLVPEGGSDFDQTYAQGEIKRERLSGTTDLVAKLSFKAHIDVQSSASEILFSIKDIEANAENLQSFVAWNDTTNRNLVYAIFDPSDKFFHIVFSNALTGNIIMHGDIILGTVPSFVV